MEVKKQYKMRIIDLSPIEKLKIEKDKTPELALKEIQEFLIKQYKNFKPKY